MLLCRRLWLRVPLDELIARASVEHPLLRVEIERVVKSLNLTPANRNALSDSSITETLTALSSPLDYSTAAGASDT